MRPSRKRGGSHECRHLLPALQAQVRQGREAQKAPRLLDLLVLRGTLHRRNAGHGVRERRPVVSGKGQLSQNHGTEGGCMKIIPWKRSWLAALLVALGFLLMSHFNAQDRELFNNMAPLTVEEGR